MALESEPRIAPVTRCLYAYGVTFLQLSQQGMKRGRVMRNEEGRKEVGVKHGVGMIYTQAPSNIPFFLFSRGFGLSCDGIDRRC